MRALAVAATASLAAACSPSSPPKLPECGPFQAVDVITLNGRDYPQERIAERLCFASHECAEDRKSYALGETCWVELGGTSEDSGPVLPGTQCAQTYTNHLGAQVEEFLVSKGGTWTREAEGRVGVTIEWDRKTKAQDGTQTVGRSTWRLQLSVQEQPGVELPDTCGKRGGFPAEDHALAAGCQEGDFVDLSAQDASRLIEFGGLLGLQYTPRCIRIAAGQGVTWRGDFSKFILAPGLKDAAGAGTQPNPIVYRPAGTEVTHAFPDVGDFLFHCSNRPEANMRGLVRVR